MSAVSCHRCERRGIGQSPEALPVGWIALFVNAWYGRGGAGVPCAPAAQSLTRDAAPDAIRVQSDRGVQSAS